MFVIGTEILRNQIKKMIYVFVDKVKLRLSFVNSIAEATIYDSFDDVKKNANNMKNNIGSLKTLGNRELMIIQLFAEKVLVQRGDGWIKTKTNSIDTYESNYIMDTKYQKEVKNE